MTVMIPDDLSIPEFLHRPMPDNWESPVVRGKRKRGTIPYPKDGYACKGAREETREKHRTSLRRRDEKMRTVKVRAKRRRK